MKKLCEICKTNPATVPDRERMGRLVNRLCSRCHALRLRGDMEHIMVLHKAAPAGRLPPLCQMVNAIAQTRKADLPEKHCEGHCHEVAVLIDGEWVTGCCHAPATGKDGQTFLYCPKCGKRIEVVK